MLTTIPILQDTRGNTIIGDTSKQNNLSMNVTKYIPLG